MKWKNTRSSGKTLGMAPLHFTNQQNCRNAMTRNNH